MRPITATMFSILGAVILIGVSCEEYSMLPPSETTETPAETCYAETYGWPRPGRCPELQPAIACLNCADQCHSDADCTDPALKCCRFATNCGNRCQQATLPTEPGYTKLV